MFIEREIDRNMKKFCRKDDCNKVDVKKDNNFEIKCCFYPPCLNTVINNNYCYLHNKDMI